MRNRVGAVAVFVSITAGASAQGLQAQLFASGFDRPVQFAASPTQSGISYVVERAGTIRTLNGNVVQGTPFLNISGLTTTTGERGLLGMAFDPNFATNGHVYLNHTDLNGNTRIARYTRSGSNPAVLDPNSRFEIMTINQPFDNHNGGTLRFGQDGFLYIGMGDGGGSNDPQRNAQNPNSLLGKMLRIDVTKDDFAGDATRNYGIPSTNPFAGNNGPVQAADEIWAFGYRNPWKFSFDPLTGAMVVGDVGQGTREEINYEPFGAGGRNYGWLPFEGNSATGLGSLAYGPDTKPIFDYPRSSGRSITGGIVYRGSQLGASFNGRYFFGDFVDRKIWSIGLTIGAGGEATASGLIEHTTALGGTSFLGNIASIDPTATGEIMIVDYNGRLIQVVPEPATLLVLGPAAVLLMRRRKRA